MVLALWQEIPAPVELGVLTRLWVEVSEVTVRPSLQNGITIFTEVLHVHHPKRRSFLDGGPSSCDSRTRPLGKLNALV